MPLVRAELLRKHQLGSSVLLHDPSLVGYWPFDKDDGDYARDRSGHVNHGTIYGATRVAGKVAGALSFDGVDDYVEIPHNASLNQGYSVVLWLKLLETLTSWEAVLEKGDQAYMLYMSDAPLMALKLHVYTTVWNLFNTAKVLSQDVWYHIAQVFDESANKLRCYIDGVEDANSPLTTTGTLSTNTSPITIAHSTRDPAKYLKSLIDEVRIYNRALSAAEVVRIMNVRGI